MREQMDGAKSADQAAGLDALVRLVGAAPGCSVGTVSYDGVLSFGITGDREAVPDLRTLCAGVREGVDEFVKEAAREGAA
ncbi:DUF1298 domain-containing protein [Actinomadura sp. DSM 109109]|nr:DUF1298 domain-containing protein [Actinomadura lepetitiana]